MTTAVSVVYLTQTASTVTTTTVSISVSISDRVSTAPGGTITQAGPTVTNAGPTITQPPEYVTITAGGGNYITVTGGGGVTVTVISYVYPSSTSRSFTCRTYATNYLNGRGPGQRNRRSVFDLDAPMVMDEYDRMPKPGAVPMA